MFVRGSGSSNESKRVDNSFYRGIVVRNNDPSKLNRVKIYIPELTNQPYDDWFEKFEQFILKSPGFNSNPKNEKEKKTNGDWEDSELFEHICNNIPWAEPCYPLMGESGNYRYYKDGKISTISDSNFPDAMVSIDGTPPSVNIGGGSPSFIYENVTTTIHDAFNNPLNSFNGNCNPYSYLYRPSNFVNKAKGIFGIPEIGSKVWVFHYEGDLNFPVYFGVYRDFRELTLINDTENTTKISMSYPSDFEN